MTAIDKLGPGLWFSIHVLALSATTFDEKTRFVHFINTLLANFPCQACVEHFRTYLTEHPPHHYWQMNQGMFNWSVNFHNSVNQRLGKDVLTYSNALELYQNPEPCSSCIRPYDNDDDTTSAIIDNSNSMISSSKIRAVPTSAVPAELLDYLAGKD